VQHAFAQCSLTRSFCISAAQAFGRGLQVPKRIYSIDELRLNKVEPEKLLSPTGVLVVPLSNTGFACVVKQRRRSCCHPQVGHAMQLLCHSSGPSEA
jgi:hypothetical protein